MIASLNAEGMMGVVMPHGVLFRGSSEKAIRTGILNDDLLEAVIGLPDSLFYGTGIPGCLLIINKNKPAERKGKVLFINGELDYEEGKNQNKLRPQDIEKIVRTFDDYTEIKRYSKIATLEEIAENDYNLNIRRYADTSPPRKSMTCAPSCMGAYQSAKWRVSTFGKRSWVILMCHGCSWRVMRTTTSSGQRLKPRKPFGRW